MDFSGNVSKKTSAVDRITLECLTNTRHYEKYLVKNNAEFNKERESNKRFYRKRIIKLTKDIIEANPKFIEDCPERLIESFNAYLEECVSYFKTVDTVDILQQEYENLVENKSSTQTETFKITDNKMSEINSIVSKTAPAKTKIEDCMTVKKIRTAPPPKKVLTKKKEIDLKNPKLKKKGIKPKNRKKDNIDNIYDEENKETPTIQKTN